MAALDIRTAALKSLEDKVQADIAAGSTYDALQYIQSFVSRKSKTHEKKLSSELVFLGARLLINCGSSAEAGTLLVWFIEDTPIDYQFHLEEHDLVGDTYCDIVRLQSLLDQYSLEQVGLMVDKIYSPLHLLCVKRHISKSSPLGLRLNQLDETFARVFEGTKRWNQAYKAIARLNQATRLAAVLDLWSCEGYKTEKPLFFARAVLQLLSDKKVELATSLIAASSNYILDNVPAASGTSPRGAPAAEATKPESCMESSLAVWHLGTILTNLASLEPQPRVDKRKLFELLMKLYMPIIQYSDPALVSILEKIGTNCFEYISQQTREQQARNPMDLMKAMFAASSNPAPKSLSTSANNIEKSQLMSTIKQLETNSKAVGGSKAPTKPVAGKK